VAFGLAVAEVKADDVFDLAPLGLQHEIASWLKNGAAPGRT
jgi:hypothetical protein